MNRFIIAFMFLTIVSSFGFSNLSYGQGVDTAGGVDVDGMTVVPTHKNCGFALDEKQADKFQKELVKSWGFEEEEE